MKKPFVSPERLAGLVREFPTPFHLYDERGIRENARRLKRAFAWNGDFREYFAVKALPNPAVMRILGEEGCGMDCSSMTELMLSEAAGFGGRDIMFSSNTTPAEEFRYARRLGAVINLDDITHIDFLDKTAGMPETVCCRFNPGEAFQYGNAIMDTPAEAKYGFTRKQLTVGFRKLMAMGVKTFGLHAFLASNELNGNYYPALARLLFQAAAELHTETGAPIGFINLSGGIGIPYRPEQKPCDIDAVGSAIRKAFEEVMVPAGLGNAAIHTELGRYMTGPCGCLVATAVHQKHIYKDYVGLDACAADLMRPAMYKAYHHITVMGKEDAPGLRRYDVTGSLCENNDKFAVDRMLPEIETGDVLVIHDTGAHGRAMGYNYNGKLRSAEVLLRADGSAELIRRAETPADYFATLDVAGLPLPAR